MPKFIYVPTDAGDISYDSADTWYWPMDEGSGMTLGEDENSIDLVLSNGSWSSNGGPNGLISVPAFNGSSTEAESNATTIGLGSTSLSFAAWIYNSISADAIIYHNRGGSNDTGFQVDLGYHPFNDEEINFRLYNTSGVQRSFLLYGVLPKNEWTHVAFTLDRSTTNSPWAIYINGSLADSGTKDLAFFGSITPTSSGGVLFGSNETASFFEGRLCDAWIFRDKVLTASEVLTLYKYLGD